MNTDQAGCSTCRPGEERVEPFRNTNGREYVQYDYRTVNGVLFSCIAPDLARARARRDDWLKRTGTPIRLVVDGLQRYEGCTIINGHTSGQTYVDWFKDDAAAEAGYRAMMGSYGFKVVSVVIGFPCIVTLEHIEAPCAS